MNIEEYKKFLKRMDWLYEYSDDYSAYRKGSVDMAKARRYADISDEHKQAFYEAYKGVVKYG